MKTQTPRQWLLERYASVEPQLDDLRRDTPGVGRGVTSPGWLRPVIVGALGLGAVAAAVLLVFESGSGDLPVPEQVRAGVATTVAASPATETRSPAPATAPGSARAVMAAETPAPGTPAGSPGAATNAANELKARINQVEQTLAQLENQRRPVADPPVDQSLPELRVPAPGSTPGDAPTRDATRIAITRNGTVIAETAPPKIYPLKELNVMPAPVLQSAPVYPEELRRTGVGGSVTVHFVVNENGDVQDARVVTSTDKRFEAPALDTVKKWKFRPGGVGGKNVSTEMEVPVNFHLPGGF